MSEQATPETTQETLFNIYFCNPPSMQVISSKGKPMVFISGRYHTKDAGEIAELDSLCEHGSGSVFKDPNRLTMSASELDPMNVLRAKFFKEFQEQQAAHLNPANDVGDSVQGPLKAASTSDIAPITAGNGPQTMAARLMAVAALKK